VAVVADESLSCYFCALCCDAAWAATAKAAAAAAAKWSLTGDDDALDDDAPAVAVFCSVVDDAGGKVMDARAWMKGSLVMLLLVACYVARTKSKAWGCS
jgi:hypothetical protein